MSDVGYGSLCDGRGMWVCSLEVYLEGKFGFLAMIGKGIYGLDYDGLSGILGPFCSCEAQL
jgi:hypothetical protein